MGTLRREGLFGAALSIAVVALAAIGACGDETSITTTCNKPGYTMFCSCADGHSGKQTCGGDGQYSPCECTTVVGSGGSLGSGGSTNISDAAGGGDVSTIATGALLSSGPSRLIDVFVASAGIIVVTADSITVVDRMGMQLHTLSAPREITAVALEGSTLAVADKAILTTYTPDLAPVGMATLTESCVAVAIVSGDRVICAGQPNFPTKFYAFNAMTGAAILTTSLTSQTTGNTLRHVLGKDDLVTFQSSFSGFQLLRVDATSLVSSMGSSPSGHAYKASSVFAFTGNPADHVITEDGILANIYAPMCDKSFTTSAQCFVQDGALGTLRGTEKFIGLDGSDGSGKAYALIDTPSSTFDTKHCVGGCTVERIDVAMKVAQTRKSYGLDLGQVVAARHDATANALVVGYARPATSSSTTAPYPGYRVELLTYE
jgi:hypothetical protein